MADEKKLSASKTQTPKLSKKDDPAYVFNPASNRYVKRDGIVGKKMQREMTREEALQHLRHHAVNTTLEHRKLLASNLSNEELLKILKKVIDIRLDEVLEIPPKPPKLVRQVGMAKHKNEAYSNSVREVVRSSVDLQSRHKKKKKKKANIPKSKQRFVLKKPPPIDTATETDMPETTDVYSESSASDSSDISDWESYLNKLANIDIETREQHDLSLQEVSTW